MHKNGRIFHIHGLEKRTLLKWSSYTKHHKCSIKSLSNFQWHSSGKRTDTLEWNHKIPQLAKSNSGQKKKIEREAFTFPDFNLYYKS